MSRSTGGGGRKEKKKEERKELQDSRKREGGGFYLARFSWRNEEERREEKIGEGRKVFTVFDFVFILHTWREITERERERSLEIEARKLFCWSSITRGYRGGSKNLSKKKWTFVWQRRWLISRIGAIIRHMRVFLSFAYLPDATNRETMQSRETHDHTRNAKLG